MTDIDRIKQEKEKWENEKVDKVTARFPEMKEQFETPSGIPVERLYTPPDTEEVDYVDDIGFPGEYPFTRGVQPTMYRSRYWTMRQYAGFGSAEETNKRFRYLIEQGQKGLSVAFDLPTQMGYDSDDELVEGEVGKTGVAIDSVRDMEILFDGIDLGRISTSMTINAPANVLLAFYIIVAEKNGAKQEDLKGTIQNDILKEYTARGTYIFPPAPSMRLITDIFSYCGAHVPKWNTISISGYHIREAGATAVQEVAFTIADGIAYVEAALEAGLDLDAFAGRLSFFFNAHSNLFEEIAKFRAARRMWAKIMKERFGAKNPRSMMLRFHTQTAGSMLTAQQAENNIVRVTLQALAGVLGGTQSLHTNSMDEALALPTEDAARIALRTQQIIAHESGAADTIDPLAGSYFIESLTGEIEKRAFEYIDKIDKMGGAVKSIEKNYMQEEIHNSAYKWQKEVEQNKRVVVGVNKFRIEEKTRPPHFHLNPEMEKAQREKLARLRDERDGDAVDAALAKLKLQAQDPKGELFPYILDAARREATLGEICNTLRAVFGVYRAK